MPQTTGFQTLSDAGMTGELGKNVELVHSLAAAPAILGFWAIAGSSQIREQHPRWWRGHSSFCTIGDWTYPFCSTKRVPPLLILFDLTSSRHPAHTTSDLSMCLSVSSAFLSPRICLLDHRKSCTPIKRMQQRKAVRHPTLYLCTVLIKKQFQTCLCFTTISSKLWY